jgi:hypothetical protein
LLFVTILWYFIDLFLRIGARKLSQFDLANWTHNIRILVNQTAVRPMFVLNLSNTHVILSLVFA